MGTLAFESAPYDALCHCVGVELTPDQSRLIDAWPDRSQQIVKSAMLNNQQRHADGECITCKGTGLLPVSIHTADAV